MYNCFLGSTMLGTFVLIDLCSISYCFSCNKFMLNLLQEIPMLFLGNLQTLIQYGTSYLVLCINIAKK